MKHRRTNRGLKILLCSVILMMPLLNQWGDRKAFATDTSIVNYMDYTVPATDVMGQLADIAPDPNDESWLFDSALAAKNAKINLYISRMEAKSYVHRDEYKVTNIRFNRVTRTLTYDTSPYVTTIRSYRTYKPGMPTGWAVAAPSLGVFYWIEGDVWDNHGNNLQDDQFPFLFENRIYVFGENSYYSNEFSYTERTVTVPGGSHSYSFADYTNAVNISYTINGDPSSIIINTKWEDEIFGGSFVSYPVNDKQQIPLAVNSPPSLNLISPNNVTLYNENGQNILNIEGFAQDPDNEDLDVTVEVPNVFYRKTKVYGALTAKYFLVPIDVIADSVPPGDYQVKVSVVDRYNFKAESYLNFSVRNHLKNKAFYLINSPVEINKTYGDYENDPQHSERYRYDQDPDFFDNSMGMIWDSGLWRSSKYTSFPFSGAYTARVQVRDNPQNDNRFDAFRMWSGDNLSSMTFLVHRKPIALFSAKLVNGSLQLSDSSYDLDHVSSPNKGLINRQWQWRKSGMEVWNDGQPPSPLPTSDPYDMRLRVRDVDGPNGIGFWSDWFQQTVGSPGNLPPVALFTVDPNNVSYRKATTITDKSFDPDNDYLDTYEWRVVKDGWQEVWYYYGGVATPPNIAGFGTGSYQVTLKVHDNRGLWSAPYSQAVQVLNHPPVADFNMPNEVYRDTVITMENLTPDPDQDGDWLSYEWYGRLNGGSYYWTGNSRNPSMTIKGLINSNGISDKDAISDNWEMRLNVSDGSRTSYATEMFVVKNHPPTADISGPSTVYQYDTRTFNSADEDLDTSDQSSLQYYWRVTNSDGKISVYRTPNIDLTFNEFGTYTLEHWAIDQIGDKSNIATLKVNVIENLPPSMTLTSPAGTPGNPTIIDAEKDGDPLIKWSYADPESDAQEKYRLEFFMKDGLLAKSVENTDSTGGTRQFKMQDQSFERFLFYSVQGRAFSKNNWSDISNEKAFIIDNPPVPGFSLVTDTGKDASLTPIYRTDVLQITSTAHDDDQLKGDSLTYKYYLKPSAGIEGLISASDSFTKQFTTNDTFTIRQVVTDSLGLWREVSHAITVKNRLPVVNLTFPTSDTEAKPTIASTMTPIMKWSYSDDDGDEQQRYRVRILDAATGGIVVQSGDQASSQKQWTVPAGALVENHKYAVEVEAYDGFDWSAASARKYFMVNLLSVKGGVKHTAEWNANRQSYNLKISGDKEQPRNYNVFWAGEKFMLQADATGLPDTIDVTMDGGFTAKLSPSDSDKTFWTGELYNSSFENLPNGPVTFTFTAKNEYNTKIDKVTVVISENWSQYFRSHRVK
ncbi:hypothetical protein ACFSF2_17855 [Paenibacillus rhizophilus]